MQQHELYPLLGIPAGGHLPADGWLCREVTHEGYTRNFKCAPATTDGRRSKHRVKYLCTCGEWIPFGRAGQHLKAKGHV